MSPAFVYAISWILLSVRSVFKRNPWGDHRYVVALAAPSLLFTRVQRHLNGTQVSGRSVMALPTSSLRGLPTSATAATTASA